MMAAESSSSNEKGSDLMEKQGEAEVQHNDYLEEEDNPNVYHKMCWKLFQSLTAMSFLWVGSQIGLYLYGSVLAEIYSEIGGAEGKWLWMVIGYLIPNSALCPFVGALSDLFGRRTVAVIGQIFLIIGPCVVSTSHQMNVAIGGMVISGFGAGLNELIALAGTSELVPIRKRSLYVALVVFTITPFIPSPMYAQLITKAHNWRFNGFLVGGWNVLGLILVLFCYHDPVRKDPRSPREILREVDYIGGILSTIGITLFMMGMQWGANQYSWGSTHVLVPFIIGAITIIIFFIWELKFAPYPMAPAALFKKDKRSMILILIITFISGGNFFVMLLFWPTQVYNVYGHDPVQIGIRTLPIGCGIIFGAAISLLLIGLTKGRSTILMIFWCCVMTAFTGAMAIADRDNLNPTVYAILTLGNVGVGAVIIPCSIIAQILSPTELIGTITAITLSIRYIGGAVAFTAYYNVFYHKLVHKYALPAGLQIVLAGITSDYDTLYKLILLGAYAEYDKLREFIAESPLVVIKGEETYNTIIHNVQLAFVEAYRWPYYISIAFGGVCVLCSLGLRDIRNHM